MTPWKLPRSVTASVVYDPHVPLGYPQRASDAAVEALWRRRVAERVRCRDEAKEERLSIFLREQFG